MQVFRYSVRMTMLALVLLVFIGGWLVLPERASDAPEVTTLPLTEEQVIVRYFAPLLPMTIESTPVLASVARTQQERQKGLSNTPYLPEHIVKLFIFDVIGYHGIWMKEMNYPIDILWLDDRGVVVHIEQYVQPDTYRNDSDAEVFRSQEPALYVIETVAGFVEGAGVSVGSVVDLPSV